MNEGHIPWFYSTMPGHLQALTAGGQPRWGLEEGSFLYSVSDMTD